MTRTKDQKPIVCFVSEAFLEEIDKACEADGIGRSQLIRNAVYAELERRGVKIPRSAKAAPSRKGKGGRKKALHASPPPS